MWVYKTPGIPDELFAQNDKVPGPTTEEVRVLTISKARLREGHQVVDVGCGAGGLTVEAALQVTSKGKIFSIDENEEAVKLTKDNITRFNVQNTVQVIRGKVPEAMLDLPKVDAVLIGGSKSLKEVIRVSHEKLKTNGRLVINAILLETSYKALDEIKKLEFKDTDVTLVFVAKGKEVNAGTMMMARNPITIISTTKI